MDNTNGGKSGDGMQFFTAGAGISNEKINTNPTKENLDLSNWMPDTPAQAAPMTPEIPTAKTQEFGSQVLSSSVEQSENPVQPPNNQPNLGEVVDITMPPGTPSQESSDKKYPEEITKILEDGTLTGKEVKNLEKEIKGLNAADLAKMFDEITHGTAESEAA